MYELTIFKSRFDNKTHRHMSFPDWNGFVDLLQRLSTNKKAGKQDAELISPAIYRDGTTRSNKNVMYWGHWAAVDVDDYEGDINGILDKYNSCNIVVYSTASSTNDKPKFRIVFDLDRNVPADQIKHFWFGLNKWLGELGDPQTKDSSRMYYIPANYDNAFNFFKRNDGAPLSVDDILNKYEYKEKSGNSFFDRLPQELQNQVIEHRKAQMERKKNISWNNYRDCPFFPKTLAKKYIGIGETGWYHTMYCIMVAIASNAIKQKYPITAEEIAKLCQEFDRDNGNWYEKRPMKVEANSALEYAYKNM